MRRRHDEPFLGLVRAACDEEKDDRKGGAETRGT